MNSPGKFCELLGTPFRPGGRDPTTGLDCMGVALYVLREMGIHVEDPWDRLHRVWADGWCDHLEGTSPTWHRLRAAAELRNGDLAVWTAHVAVFVDGLLLSAAEGVGFFRASMQSNVRRLGQPQVWRYS